MNDAADRPTPALDALAHGESTPSLDAIRAWQMHGGQWLVVNPASGRLRTDVLALCDADHARVQDGRPMGYVTVRDGRSLPEDVRHDLFVQMTRGTRWWRVRDDGTLAIGQAR